MVFLVRRRSTIAALASVAMCTVTLCQAQEESPEGAALHPARQTSPAAGSSSPGPAVAQDEPARGASGADDELTGIHRFMKASVEESKPYRNLFGTGLLIVAASTTPAGILVSERSTSAAGPFLIGLGVTSATFAVLNFLPPASAESKLMHGIEQRRAAALAPLDNLLITRREWEERAAAQRTARHIYGYVLGISGGVLVTTGSLLAMTKSNIDLDPRAREEAGATSAGVGAIMLVAGAVLLTSRGSFEQSFESYEKLRPRGLLGRSPRLAPNVGFSPVPHGGGMFSLSGTF